MSEQLAFQLGTMHASRPCPALSSHGEEGAGRTAGGPQGLGHSAGSAGTRPGCGAAAARQAPWLTRPCQPDSTVSLPTQVWTRVSQPPPRGAGAGRARGPLPVLAVPLERPFSPRFCGGGGAGGGKRGQKQAVNSGSGRSPTQLQGVSARVHTPSHAGAAWILGIATPPGTSAARPLSSAHTGD